MTKGEKDQTGKLCGKAAPPFNQKGYEGTSLSGFDECNGAAEGRDLPPFRKQGRTGSRGV